MNKKFSLFFFLVFLFTINSKAVAVDINVTPWPMYQQNAAHTGFVDVDINPKAFKFAWKAYIGDKSPPHFPWINGVVVSAAVVEDNIVVVSRLQNDYINTLQAFSLKNGLEIWKKSYSGETINAPTLHQGKIFVQMVEGKPALYAYNVLNGEVIFTSYFDAGELLGYLAPTVYKDQIYMTGGRNSGVYSLNALTGIKNWFQPLSGSDAKWTPAINEKYAIGYTFGALNVFDRVSGNLIINISDPNHFWNAGMEYAPVILNDSQVAIALHEYLTIFDINNQNVFWTNGPGFWGQPSYDGEYIYALYKDNFAAVDATTGKIAWQWNPNKERILWQQIITNNLIFISTDKKVYAISKKTHKPVWAYQASGRLSLGMGYLFIVEHTGNLTAIKVQSS